MIGDGNQQSRQLRTDCETLAVSNAVLSKRSRDVCLRHACLNPRRRSPALASASSRRMSKVETYAGSVLPMQLRQASLLYAVAQELRWVAAELP